MVTALMCVYIPTGCANLGKAPENAPAPDPDAKIVSGLQSEALRTQKLLGELVALERARGQTPSVKLPKASDRLAAGHPLLKLVTITTRGEAAAVLGRIADLHGFGFYVTGRPIPTLVVSLNVRQIPLADVLEIVGSQLGVQADVIYRQGDNALELNYSDAK